MSGVAHSWREHESKISELRSETLDSIATLILDLEEQVSNLSSDLDRAREIIADLESAA